MPTEIVPAPQAALSTEIREAVENAANFVRESVPESTRRAYATDWASFSEWCRQKRVQNLPADPRVIAAYLADESKHLRPKSLRRRLAAIAKMHKVSGHPPPTSLEPVPSTMKGIERTFGTASVEAKSPATFDAVERMVATYKTGTLDGLRNRAIILMGFAGAFRRSELVALTADDLRWSEAGVVITVRRSKTDQRGEGKTKAIPFVTGGDLCAATALRAWLVASGITSGPLFRPFARNGKPKGQALSAHSVAIIVKMAAEAAGLDPSTYSGHSLRAGHVTEARRRKVADADTMAITGHKRIETLDLYDRRGNPFDKTSAGAVMAPRK